MAEQSDITNPEAEIRNLKFSVESGSSPNDTRIGQLQSKYRLTPGVQVRDETFGLLFYNYRGPRLYFVPSKDIIAAEFFNGRQSVDDLIEAVSARKGRDRRKIASTITMILTQLEEKGLICGQSIC